MDRIPIVPMRLVAYPGQVVPLRVNTERERHVIRAAMDRDRPIGLVLDHSAEVAGGEAPSWMSDDVGTTLRILVHATQRTDGADAVVARGERRFRVVKRHEDGLVPEADVEWLDEPVGGAERAEAAADAVAADVDALIGSPELDAVRDDPVATAYAVAAALDAPLRIKQRLLALRTAVERLELERVLLAAFRLAHGRVPQ